MLSSKIVWAIELAIAAEKYMENNKRTQKRDRKINNRDFHYNSNNSNYALISFSSPSIGPFSSVQLTESRKAWSSLTFLFSFTVADDRKWKSLNFGFFLLCVWLRLPSSHTTSCCVLSYAKKFEPKKNIEDGKCGNRNFISNNTVRNSHMVEWRVFFLVNSSTTIRCLMKCFNARLPALLPQLVHNPAALGQKRKSWIGSIIVSVVFVPL